MLRIELPLHGPSFATLIELIAKNRGFIVDIDVERLSSLLAFEPSVFIHKPALVTIMVRTKSAIHEEHLLHMLTTFGFIYSRT